MNYKIFKGSIAIFSIINFLFSNTVYGDVLRVNVIDKKRMHKAVGSVAREIVDDEQGALFPRRFGVSAKIRAAEILALSDDERDRIQAEHILMGELRHKKRRVRMDAARALLRMRRVDHKITKILSGEPVESRGLDEFIELRGIFRELMRRGDIKPVVAINIKGMVDDMEESYTRWAKEQISKDKYGNNIQFEIALEELGERKHDMPGGFHAFEHILDCLSDDECWDKMIIIVTDGGFNTRMGLKTLLYGQQGRMPFMGDLDSFVEFNIAVGGTILLLYPEVYKSDIIWVASDNAISPGEMRYLGQMLSHLPSNRAIVSYGKKNLIATGEENMAIKEIVEEYGQKEIARLIEEDDLIGLTRLMMYSKNFQDKVSLYVNANLDIWKDKIGLLDSLFIETDESRAQAIVAEIKDLLWQFVKESDIERDLSVYWDAVSANEDQWFQLNKRMSLDTSFDIVRDRIKPLTSLGIFTERDGYKTSFKEKEEWLTILMEAQRNGTDSEGQAWVYANAFCLTMHKEFWRRIWERVKQEVATTEDRKSLDELEASLFRTFHQSRYETVAGWSRMWSQLHKDDYEKWLEKYESGLTEEDMIKFRPISYEDWMRLSNIVREELNREVEVDGKPSKREVYVIDFGEGSYWGDAATMRDSYLINREMGLPREHEHGRFIADMPLYRQERGYIDDRVTLNLPLSGSYLMKHVYIYGEGELTIEDDVELQDVKIYIPQGRHMVISRGSQVVNSRLMGEVEFVGERLKVDRLFVNEDEKVIVRGDEAIGTLKVVRPDGNRLRGHCRMIISLDYKGEKIAELIGDKRNWSKMVDAFRERFILLKKQYLIGRALTVKEIVQTEDGWKMLVEEYPELSTATLEFNKVENDTKTFEEIIAMSENWESGWQKLVGLFPHLEVLSFDEVDRYKITVGDLVKDREGWDKLISDGVYPELSGFDFDEVKDIDYLEVRWHLFTKRHPELLREDIIHLISGEEMGQIQLQGLNKEAEQRAIDSLIFAKLREEKYDEFIKLPNYLGVPFKKAQRNIDIIALDNDLLSLHQEIEEGIKVGGRRIMHQLASATELSDRLIWAESLANTDIEGSQRIALKTFMDAIRENGKGNGAMGKFWMVHHPLEALLRGFEGKVIVKNNEELFNLMWEIIEANPDDLHLQVFFVDVISRLDPDNSDIYIDQYLTYTKERDNQHKLHDVIQEVLIGGFTVMPVFKAKVERLREEAIEKVRKYLKPHQKKVDISL